MTDLINPGSLLDALLGRGIMFHRSVSDPNEVTICCPFCNDRKFRLGFNLRKDVGHCFNCDWRSRRAAEDLSSALELGILSGVQEEQAEVEAPPPALPEDFMLLYDPPKDTLCRRARNYLIERGVKDWQMEEKKIGVSFVGKLQYRVIFPVYYGKKLQGVVARDFTGQQEPKYLNSFGDRPLYNSPDSKKNKAFLCEGVFDCLALERVIPTMNYDVLALLGHSITDKQEERLEEYRDLVLWPDADVPGVKGFLELGKQLAMHHRVHIVPPCNTGKDAGEMGKSDIAYAWATRTRLTEGLELRLRAEAAFRE